MWNCYPIMMLFLCDIHERERMYCAEVVTAVRQLCVRCLLTVNDILSNRRCKFRMMMGKRKDSNQHKELVSTGESEGQTARRREQTKAFRKLEEKQSVLYLFNSEGTIEDNGFRLRR